MKFKQVLAGLLVGTMVVTSAPVSGLGALSALAASDETADEYAELAASALTGTADSQETTGEGNTSGFATAAVDGNASTFWHTQYSGGNNIVLGQEDPANNKNNNYYISLDKKYTVSAVTYVPRTGSNGKVEGNGYITKCNVYTSTDNGETWSEATAGETWSYSDTDVKRTVTLATPAEGVNKIKIEVLESNGAEGANKYINAAEFGVLAKEYVEDTRAAVVAPSISVTAPAVDAAPEDATSLDYVDNAQVFADTAENPATLSSDNVTVEKEEDGTQAFSGQIKAANDGENNGKFDVSGTTPFVINFKIKADEVSDTTWLVGKMDDQYGVQVSPTTFDVYAHAKDESWPTLRATLPDNFWGNWHEITAVYTGSTFRLFIDGNETATLNKTFELASYSSNLFTIGYNNAKTSGNGFLRPYAGKLADLTMYSGGDAITSDATYDAIMASLENRTQILNIDAKAAETVEPNYTVTTAWTDSKGETVTSFTADKAYTLTATLTAKEGYKFTEDSKPSTIKVGDEEVEVEAAVSADGNTLTLTHTFGEDKETPVESEARKALAAALADAAKVEAKENYTEDSYKAFEEALAAANAVTDETSDEDVQKIADALKEAIENLKEAETPTPPAEDYEQLTGLTGKADSEETKGETGGSGPAAAAVDGNESTFWHSQYSASLGGNNVVLNQEDPTQNQNNNYYITLNGIYTVKEFNYLPRTKDDGTITGNGAITACNVYTSSDGGETWTKAGSGTWTYEGTDVKKTITFENPIAGVTDIKVEALSTKGAVASNDNLYINAAEFGVIGKKDAETPDVSEARKALAAALADAAKVEAKENYTEDSYKAFEEALAAAKAVTDETSDEEVQTIATALADAIKALKKAETPTPPVTGDSVITAPKLSYTAPVAGETAVVPGYVAMEDQAENPATLEQKDDVKTTVGEDDGVWAFQGRLTAPNSGANNAKFDVSGDTPMVLRTKVKLNDKTDEVVNILGKMDEQYGIQVDGANDRVILYCCDANGKWPEVQYKYDADTFWGQWHDIALVYTGTNMQLYVDGEAGIPTTGRPNASAGYQVVFKSSASSIFTIGYNTAKSTNHDADGNGVHYSTLDQVDGKIADIKLYKGKDYSEGLTKSYDEIKAALETAVPDADISATPYTAETTWTANGAVLEENAKFAEETVYTATTVYTACAGFKFTDISKPSVDGATVTIAADGKTMTVTKTFPATAKIVCSCALGEITGVNNQNVDLGVADSKSVTLNAKAQVTGDCKVEGHDGTVNYTYTIVDAGTTGATVKDGVVTVTAAGTAKVKVTATLAADPTKTSTKEITLTVTTNKASAEDKAKLTAAIDAVKDVAEADYTAESYKVLNDALTKAKELKDKTNASKTEVEDAIKAINDAKKGLKTKVAAKKEELNSLLAAVYDDLMTNVDKYTVASYNEAVKVYKAVKGLPAKEGVTVAELEQAITDLTDAKNALVLQETADLEKAKENASAALKNAEAIANAGRKDYEEASWKAFDAAYKALKDAPADADKATLESLTLALKNAQAALKKAETPAPTPEVTLDAPKVKAAKAKVTKTGVVVNVTVEAVKDAASYDVYRVVKGKATKVGTTAAGKTTVKDTKAVKGASYYAVAVSKDGKVVSKAGAAVAVKLAKAPKIQKATVSSKNVKLSWKKVKGAKVVVYRSTKKNSGYRKVATTKKNAASVTNKKGLKAGKTYYYKIATIKGKLISAMSKAKRVKIKK